LGAPHQLRRSYLFFRAGPSGPGAKLVARRIASKAGTSWFSPHVMHDAYRTFKVPVLHQQVQRKESIAHIYQNADLPGCLGRRFRQLVALSVPVAYARELELKMSPNCH